MLRSTARPIDGAFIIFKGGTSLSKAFDLIERFSEDVDILVLPDPTLGVQRVHRILKNICERAAVDLGIGPTNQVLHGSETGVHRNVRYLYPARLPPSTVTEGVLLEMGRRGGGYPHERRALRSMIASYAIGLGLASEDEYEEFASFEIDVLSPERTLVEKLALLHRLSRTDRGAGLAGQGRHLYDIFKLLTAESVIAKLRADPGTVARLAEDADRESARWGLPYDRRPERGFADSPAFNVTEAPAVNLRRGLEAAAGLVYGSVPSFEECISAIQESADLL